MKTIILILLVITTLGLKPSEAGVNDWHLSNIGELRSLSFARSKLQYVSALGQIGVLDRASGKVESRFVVSDTEKVVRWASNEFTVATRHNQVLTYSFKGSSVETTVNNHALGDQNKIESYAKTGKKEYFLTPQTLTEDKTVVREAKAGEEFLSVTGGVGAIDTEVIFLAYSNGNQLCVENYRNFNFINLYCLESSEKVS